MYQIDKTLKIGVCGTFLHVCDKGGMMMKLEQFTLNDLVRMGSPAWIGSKAVAVAPQPVGDRCLFFVIVFGLLSNLWLCSLLVVVMTNFRYQRKLSGTKNMLKTAQIKEDRANINYYIYYMQETLVWQY